MIPELTPEWALGRWSQECDCAEPRRVPPAPSPPLRTVGHPLPLGDRGTGAEGREMSCGEQGGRRCGRHARPRDCQRYSEPPFSSPPWSRFVREYGSMGMLIGSPSASFNRCLLRGAVEGEFQRKVEKLSSLFIPSRKASIDYTSFKIKSRMPTKTVAGYPTAAGIMRSRNIYLIQNPCGPRYYRRHSSQLSKLLERRVNLFCVPIL